MSKELTPLEAVKELRQNNIYDTHLFDNKLLNIIETALKNYEELRNTPPILCGRTHGYTQSIIDYICKNYKEVKVTNLEDEDKVKALEIIKNKEVDVFLLKESPNLAHYNRHFDYSDYIKLTRQLTQEEYELLKEVLL